MALRQILYNCNRMLGGLDSTFFIQSKLIHCTCNNLRDVVDRKEMLRSLPKIDEGTSGEKAEEMDILLKDKQSMFPTKDTPNQLFNGIRFRDLPIFNIKSSPNNTIISLTNSKGDPQMLRSCGIEGFKNTRKGTNIAAQATAITIGTKAYNKGIKTVRVRVRGVGPGRMSSIKGLQMAGLQIVSITDNTPVSWNPPRPRKQRKL
ncbi:28S ribosomal protein S11, mitochondrial [Coccinella septempunctata]|uniref:28S ribosomal protein S11, mitochondrial n=1 Tax=Coccinella septempunctata TaxID=41139 RepID=UPI001D099965|nr:28S ribosomal protein S11, mitochondrial [Coccinella septempunctata]